MPALRSLVAVTGAGHAGSLVPMGVLSPSSPGCGGSVLPMLLLQLLETAGSCSGDSGEAAAGPHLPEDGREPPVGPRARPRLPLLEPLSRRSLPDVGRDDGIFASDTPSHDPASDPRVSDEHDTACFSLPLSLASPDAL